MGMLYILFMRGYNFILPSSTALGYPIIVYRANKFHLLLVDDYDSSVIGIYGNESSIDHENESFASQELNSFSA